jgi:acetyltransferase-like isoleucine patch superfamily enzyme
MWHDRKYFFDRTDLKKCGDNVIMGKTVRIRYPELVSIGDNVIIDDFTYISTELEIDTYVHIAAGCKIIGEPKSEVVMREFSALAPNVVLSAGSAGYRSGIAGPFFSTSLKANALLGCIEIGRHSIVGANSTTLSNVLLRGGAAVAAQSQVKKSLAS